METFLWIFSFVFCNMLFRSKFSLLAFCMFVRSKWKIEILKVTQRQDLVNKMKKKLPQKYKQEKEKSSRSGTGKRKKMEVLWNYWQNIVWHFSFRFFLISPRCRSVSLLNRWWLFLIRFKSHFTLKMSCKMMASSWREGVIKNWNRTQLEKNLLSWVV